MSVRHAAAATRSGGLIGAAVILTVTAATIATGVILDRARHIRRTRTP